MSPPAIKREDLTRFKASDRGLIDFATLLEQATPERRQRITEELEIVDRPFLRRVLKKTVYFEELVYIDDSILAEILSKVTPQILAHAIKNVPEPFRKHLLAHLTYPEMKVTLDEEDRIKGKNTLVFEEGAKRHILKIGRQLEKEGKFAFEIKDCPRFKQLIKRSAAM